MAHEKEEVRLGDYVELSAHRIGMVKYVGEIQGKKGIFYGVELWKGNIILETTTKSGFGLHQNKAD